MVRATERRGKTQVGARASGADLVASWEQTLLSVPWTLFATLTFAEAPGREQADRCWYEWRRHVRLRLLELGETVCSTGPFRVRAQRLPRRNRRCALWSCRATELQRRGAIHFHAVLGCYPELRQTLAELYRVGLAQTWQQQAKGCADVQLIQSQGAVAAYVAKYVVKSCELDLVVPRSQLQGCPALEPHVVNLAGG